MRPNTGSLQQKSKMFPRPENGRSRGSQGKFSEIPKRGSHDKIAGKFIKNSMSVELIKNWYLGRQIR